MSSSIASLLFGFGVMTSYVHGQSSTAASFTVKPGFEVQAVCPGLSRDALDSAFDFSASIPSQMALNAEGDKLYLLYTEVPFSCSCSFSFSFFPLYVYLFFFCYVSLIFSYFFLIQI